MISLVFQVFFFSPQGLFPAVLFTKVTIFSFKGCAFFCLYIYFSVSNFVLYSNLYYRVFKWPTHDIGKEVYEFRYRLYFFLCYFSLPHNRAIVVFEEEGGGGIYYSTQKPRNLILTVSLPLPLLKNFPPISAIILYSHTEYLAKNNTFFISILSRRRRRCKGVQP